jgi:membrane protein DedA with SNARE-associated domain
MTGGTWIFVQEGCCGGAGKKSRPFADRSKLPLPLSPELLILALLQDATPHLDWWEMLRRLWEYILLGLSGIVTEEATPLIGGLRAHTGHLRLVPVALWITAGTWAAHLALYELGRWRADWVLRSFPNARRHVMRVLGIVERHPWRSSLAVRFAYGLRIALPIACGAARVRLPVYIVGSGISAFVWSFLFTLLGWALGETTLQLLGHVRRYEKWVGLALILVLVALAFVLMRRRHVDDEVVEALSKGDDSTTPTR